MTQHPPPATPRPNTTLVVAAILSGVVVLLLLLLLLLHRSAAPVRRPEPLNGPAPHAAGPLAPVYGGGAPPGKRRIGF